MRSTRSEYTLTVKGSATELSVNDCSGYNQSDATAQFTSGGRDLAPSHQTADRQNSGITTIDLLHDKVDRVDAIALVDSPSWSPDGSRLLVASSPGAYPEVLDTQDGSLTPRRGHRRPPWLTLIGRLDNVSLLAYRDVGSRMHLVAVDLKSGQRRGLAAPRGQRPGVRSAASSWRSTLPKSRHRPAESRLLRIR